MITLSAKDFENRYGGESTQSFSRINQAQKPTLFNVDAAKSVFRDAAQDIQTAVGGAGLGGNISVQERLQGSSADPVATAALQGGLAPFRATGAGFFGTEKVEDVTGSVIDKMTQAGDVITPDTIQNYIGDFATEVISGFNQMTPEEQLVEKNKLAVAELASFFGGGTVAKEAVVDPITTAAKDVGKATTQRLRDLAKSSDEVIKSGDSLRESVRAIVGEKSVDPQVKASAERLIADPTVPDQFLQGTAGRTEDVVTRYDKYLTQSQNAIDDIKVDPAIAVVGERMGNSFDSVIKQRSAVGEVLSDELKTAGKYRVSVTDSTRSFIEELADSGLSYNPRTNQLTSFQGNRFVAQEVDMLSEFLQRMRLLGDSPTVRDIDNFVAKSRSELDFAKGQSGVLKTTNAERIINGGIASLKESLDPAKNGISQLAPYWKANKTYSDLSSFIEEGSKYLGRVTQAGDYAKDASIAKSAVQSILNNGKKDWMLRLESLTGYKALDDAVLALQAMKDAGDFRGLSLLQAMKDSGMPTTQSSVASAIVDKGVDLGKRVIAGDASDQTRAFLKSLGKQAGKADLKTPDKKVQAPKGTTKTKEIVALEKKIAKNVDSQKAAAKAKDFKLVTTLKKAYKALVAELKDLVRFAKENIKSEKGSINFGADRKVKVPKGMTSDELITMRDFTDLQSGSNKAVGAEKTELIGAMQDIADKYKFKGIGLKGMEKEAGEILDAADFKATLPN